MRTRIAVAALAAVLLAGVVPQTKSRLTTALGRFFRDVARARARTRRYGNKYALAQMVLKTEAPLDLSKPQHDGTVTLSELEDGDGTDGAPIYVALRCVESNQTRSLDQRRVDGVEFPRHSGAPEI